MRFLPCVLAICLVTLTGAAAADETTPTAISDTTVPALTCAQPDLPDLTKVTSKELKAIQAKITAYGDCVQHYIDERHAKSSVYISLQKAEVDAGNAAVKTFNAFFAQVRELQDKEREKYPPKAAK